MAMRSGVSAGIAAALLAAVLCGACTGAEDKQPTGPSAAEPLTAMQFRDGPEKDDFVKFYDQVSAEV